MRPSASLSGSEFRQSQDGAEPACGSLRGPASVLPASGVCWYDCGQLLNNSGANLSKARYKPDTDHV